MSALPGHKIQTAWSDGYDLYDGLNTDHHYYHEHFNDGSLYWKVLDPRLHVWAKPFDAPC